jgi:quercetin dioxygenase-like cupin family protein
METTRMAPSLKTAALIVVGAISLAAPAIAQTDAIKRTVLQRMDVAGEAKEMVMAVIDIPPRTESPRQTHPGEEFGYLLAGDLTVRIDGLPARTLRAGDTFAVARGAKHSTSTLGGVKLLVTWTVDQGAPLATNVQ